MKRVRLEVDIRVTRMYMEEVTTEGRRIRVFVQGPPSGHPSWWDLTLLYLQALADHQLPARAIALYGQALDLQHPGWEAVSSLFLGPLTDRFVNVVLGFGFPWSELYTEGLVNIAVTDDLPRDLNEGELEALRKYQHVYFVDAAHEHRHHWPFKAEHAGPAKLAEVLGGLVNGKGP